MSDYRVVVKVQNGRIFERIREMGFKSVAQLCKAHSLRDTEIGKILNLRKSPVNRKNQFITSVVALANALQVDPEDLFTERQYEAVPSNVKEFLVEEHHMAQLMSDSAGPEHRLALIEMAAGIQQRAGLNEQQRSVIDMRFRQDMTLYEVAEKMGLTSERIRQIEAQALRKMRNPKAIKDIKSEDISP